MKRSIRIVLAIILIIFLSLLWFGLGAALFGWKNGGGAIPMILYFGLVTFVWSTITKKTSEEKGKLQNSTNSNDPRIEGP